jgi:trans-aconitate methyltransferase
MPYDPTIYLGSAAHYRSVRPAYSPELEAVLTRGTGLDGNVRLLDVGCGPGVLTVRLAHLFEHAVGLDPDADMLAEGCRAAEESRIMNNRWVQGLAEDLPAVAPGPYRLVTFGQSFRWTDEQRVAEAVYDMLQPCGALALIVHTVMGRPAHQTLGCLQYRTMRSRLWWRTISDLPSAPARAPPQSELTLRGCAGPDSLWCSAAVLRPGHPRPAAR